MTYTWTAEDYQTLSSLSAQQNPPIDPAQVALIFLWESGLDPSNPGPSGANVGGLNQMSSSNLSSLGLTMSQWLSMSASEQLPYIFKWWNSLVQNDNNGVFPTTGGMLYALNFLPGQFKSVGAGNNPNAVLASKTGAYSAEYNSNSTLDPNHTGSITPNTCQTLLNNIANSNSTWPAFLSNLREYAVAPITNVRAVALAVLGGLF